jgi:hypothetical protein
MNPKKTRGGNPGREPPPSQRQVGERIYRCRQQAARDTSRRVRGEQRAAIRGDVPPFCPGRAVHPAKS